MPALLEIDSYQLVIPLSKISLLAENDDDSSELKYYMIYPKLSYKYISGEYQAEQKDIELSKGVYHLLVLLKASNPDCIISLNKLEDLSGEEISQYIKNVKADLEFFPKLKIKKLANKLSKTSISNQTLTNTNTKSDSDSEQSEDSDQSETDEESSD